MPIQPAPHKRNGFSHGKCRQNCSHSQAFDLSQKYSSHSCRHHQADHIKKNFNSGISDSCYLCQFPWKKIRRHNRKAAAVLKCNAKADERIAYHKIQYPHSYCIWQNRNPGFMKIQQFSKYKPNDKAEQILRYKFSS